MTHRERMRAVFAGRPVDRIPVHHLQFSGHAARVILGRDACVGGAYLQWRELHALWNGPDAHREFEAQCETDAVAIAEACGHDLLRLNYWRWPAAFRPVEKRDDCTFVVRHTSGATRRIEYRPDMELLVWEGGADGIAPRLDNGEEVSEARLRRRVEEEEARTAAYAPPPGADAAMAALIRKYPEYLLRLGGPTVGVDMMSVDELTESALWPDLMARLLMARAARYARDIPRMAAAGMEVDIAGMDFCSKDGPSISPDAFRRLVLPALKVLVDACHAAGLRYVFSSDGNFWPVADMMFEEAGVDGWMEVDKSAGMDLRELRRRFPRRTFVGNVPVQVLHTGSRQDAIREAMSCLDAAHELGGIVVGASNMIMPGTPPGNILALLETIEANR